MEINLELWPTQYRFMTSKARYSAIISGLGLGKTFCGCLRGVMTAMEHPRSRGIITAKTYKNLEDFVIPTLTEDIWDRIGQPEAWDEICASFNRNDMRIKLVNGSEIYLRSCERPDNLRGPNLSWFFIDEASKVPHKVWSIMVGRLRVAPERGWITTTPRGRNWVWHEFARRPRKNYEWFQGSTDENKVLSTEYKDSLKESYVGNFLAQEYYGEFVGWEGLVYEIDPFKHFCDAPEPGSDYRYAIAGVDWGWIDPTVIEVGLVGFDGRVHLVEEYYQKKVHIDDIVAAAAALKEKWGIRTFYCDPSRPEYLAKFRAAGCDARKGKKELDPGIALVNKYLATFDEDPETGERIERDPLMVMDDGNVPYAVDEFEVYAYEEDDMGKILKNKPMDANNHCMDAVRYMICGFNSIGHVGSRRGR